MAETQYATWLKLAVVARLYKVIFHNLPQLVIRRNS
jgi:hypothetical protein